MKEAVDPRSAEGREQQDLLQSQILQIVRTLRKTNLRRAIFFLRGVPADAAEWPPDRPVAEKFFVNANGEAMHSSMGGKAKSMLSRVRAVMLAMQLEAKEDGSPAFPALAGVEVSRVTNYCWKISGVSAMHSGGVKEAMIKGQGRWGLYAKRPSEMIHYYRRALLEEILRTTNL